MLPARWEEKGKAFAVSVAFILMLIPLQPVESQDTSYSQILVEGFTALQDLTLDLKWGNYNLTQSVPKSSTNISLSLNEANIREPIVLTLSPDALLVELTPSPTGYEVRRAFFGSNIKLEKVLKIAIKELLTTVNLTLEILPTKRVTSFSINGRVMQYQLVNQSLNYENLIVDFQRPLNVSAVGDDFSMTLIIRRGLSSDQAIDVWCEATGNVSNVKVRATPAKILGLQFVEIPLETLNITRTLETFEDLNVIFLRGSSEKFEKQKEEKPQEAQPTGVGASQPLSSNQTINPLSSTLLNAIARYKFLILVAAFLLLFVAVVSGKLRSLGALALLMFLAYFGLMILGGGVV
jgi:hypothetical protein